MLAEPSCVFASDMHMMSNCTEAMPRLAAGWPSSEAGSPASSTEGQRGQQAFSQLAVTETASGHAVADADGGGSSGDSAHGHHSPELSA